MKAKTHLRRVAVIVLLVILSSAHFGILTLVAQSGKKDSASLPRRALVAKYLERGDTFSKKKLYEEAEEQYRAAIRLDSRNEVARRKLAQTLAWGENEWEESFREFETALRLNPQDAITHVAFAQALRWAPVDVNTKIDGLVLKRHEQAMQECRTAAAIKPDYSDAHTCLGNLLTEAYDECGPSAYAGIAEYQQVVRLQPKNPLPHIEIARCFSKMQFWHKAVAEHREAIRLLSAGIHPELAEPNKWLADAHIGLARDLDSLGQEEEAAAEYREAIRLDPNSDYKRDLSNLFEEATKEERGSDVRSDPELQEALGAVHTDPQDPDAHLKICKGLWRNGDRSGALEECRHAIQLSPDHICLREQAHEVIGSMFYDENRLDSAIEEFREATRLGSLPNQRCIAPRRELGRLLEERGDLEEAKEQYRLSITPNGRMEGGLDIPVGYQRLLHWLDLRNSATASSISSPASDHLSGAQTRADTIKDGTGKSTIMFTNSSGMNSLVLVLGSSSVHMIDLPNAYNSTVDVAAGTYSFIVRFGGDSAEYVYQQGGPLRIQETQTQHSSISITLKRTNSDDPAAHREFKRLYNKIDSLESQPETEIIPDLTGMILCSAGQTLSFKHNGILEWQIRYSGRDYKGVWKQKGKNVDIEIAERRLAGEVQVQQIWGVKFILPPSRGGLSDSYSQEDCRLSEQFETH